MRNKNNWFWLIQIGGWTLMAMINYLAQRFSTNIPTILLYLNSIGVSFAGLLITSGYRYYLKQKGNPFKLQAGKFVLSLFGATFIQSVCWLSLISLMFLPFLPKYHIPILQLLLNIVPLTGVLLIWNLVYFSYHLVKQYHNNIVEKWQMEAEVQKARLGALKSQINPHFMFNSLNNIRALILEDPQLARKMITKFSGIFRYALLYSENKEIAIANELEVLGQYLELVKLQYEEKFVYRISFDENLQSETIPPMILQLLVENAVKHGIALSTAGGELFIEITKENGAIKLVVKNTGTLHVKNELEESLGIGLSNIRERLRLLYNNNASIQLLEESPYVIVTIYIHKS